MNKIFRFVWITLAVILVLMQFIPSELPEVISDNPNDLIKTELITGDIADILVSACYDCHSNQTEYPWYSYVAPVRWLIVRDVNEGRDELNLSDWAGKKTREKIKILSEIAESVEDGEMPFKPYKITHSEARLTADQINMISEWSSSLSEKILGD